MNDLDICIALKKGHLIHPSDDNILVTRLSFTDEIQRRTRVYQDDAF